MTKNYYQLELLDPSLAFPVWSSASCVALVGMLCLPLAESDLDDSNRLPYGHLAFVEEQAVLWVCRAWFDGRELGHLLVQLSADLEQVYALHDWQLQTQQEQDVRQLLLALMGSVDSGLRVVAADEAMQHQLEVVLGRITFDPYNCAQLHWAVHAKACLND